VAYHPPQRPVGAFILSLDRWMRATFHLAKLHAFEEHLARGRSFFSLTNVSLGQGAPLPFLALRASAAHVVVPEVPEPELRLQAVVGAHAREVSCYLERVAVHGTLELLPDVRTSDFLSNQTGFILLRDCRIVPPLAGRPEIVPLAFVNAGAILALAEDGAPIVERAALDVRRVVASVT
jgi:hypothetical protein